MRHAENTEIHIMFSPFNTHCALFFVFRRGGENIYKRMPDPNDP